MNHPSLFPEPMTPGLDSTVVCPDCGYTDTLAAFEVGGADEGNVFCPKCLAEFAPEGAGA